MTNLGYRGNDGAARYTPELEVPGDFFSLPSSLNEIGLSLSDSL